MRTMQGRLMVEYDSHHLQSKQPPGVLIVEPEMYKCKAVQLAYQFLVPGIASVPILRLPQCQHRSLQTSAPQRSLWATPHDRERKRRVMGTEIGKLVAPQLHPGDNVILQKLHHSDHIVVVMQMFHHSNKNCWPEPPWGSCGILTLAESGSCLPSGLPLSHAPNPGVRFSKMCIIYQIVGQTSQSHRS